MIQIKSFMKNGGHVKIMLWAIFGIVVFLVKLGWTAKTYDGRLCNLEKAQIKNDLFQSSVSENIIRICEKLNVPYVRPGDRQ